MTYDEICRYVSTRDLAKILDTTTDAIRQRKYRKIPVETDDLIIISNYLKRRAEKFEELLEKGFLL